MGAYGLDLGTFSTDPVDHPDYARAVGQAVLRGFVDAGMLICGSGAGASIAANKIRGVRAVMANSETLARYAREHNGANVLTLGATLVSPGEARAIDWAHTSGLVPAFALDDLPEKWNAFTERNAKYFGR